MTTTLITPTPGPAASPRRSKRASQGPVGGRGGGDAWKLVLPCLLPVMLFSVYPLLRGIYLGFTDAEAGLNATTTFTGLENYRNLRGYDLFWDSFRIGLIWTVSVTTLQFFLSLALALLLNLDLKLRWLARTLALVPWAIPPVIVAIMWRLMLHPRSGAVNKVLRELGFAGDTNWLGDFKYALPAAILVGVWSGMPQTTITLLAGLQSVPEELNEAAAIDGAGSVRRFFHVTLPALRPIILAITTLDLINNFNSFALVYTLTAGGPGGKTMLPSLFVYNEAFQFGHWGYAAAMGNVMVIVVGTFLVIYLWAGGRPGRAAA
jgi:multiple sugar transport system permease protein